MRIHPREQIVRQAELDLSKAVLEIVTKSQLTEAEQLRVLASVLAGEVGSIAKYAIRFERHGDSDTPGGLAKD